MILPTLCSLLLGAALAKPQPRPLPANTARNRYVLEPGLHSFTSINHPDDYDNDYKQRWVFRGSEDQDITVECDHFDLEDHRRCRYDFLKINGDKYCGTGPVGPITSARLKIVFKTDSSVTQSGFFCLVTVPGDGVTTEGTTAETTAATTETTAETTAETTEGTTQTPGERSCGIANREVRIVGGGPTEVNEYPWQVGLVNTDGDEPWCGGSIISTEWILTAAHCTQGESATGLQVLLGKHNTSSDENQITRNVAQIVSHPNYNSNTFSSDISLLKLSEPIEFSAEVSPVCLPTGGDFGNVEAIVTGWGSLSSGGQYPDVLQEVTVNTMSNTECEEDYGDRGRVDSTMICADVEDGGKDSCQGDSGGPLVTDVGGRFHQIGIVSWGRSCADQRWPGVYSRVTEFSSWIATTMADVRLF